MANLTNGKNPKQPTEKAVEVVPVVTYYDEVVDKFFDDRGKAKLAKGVTVQAVYKEARRAKEAFKNFIQGGESGNSANSGYSVLIELTDGKEAIRGHVGEAHAKTLLKVKNIRRSKVMWDDRPSIEAGSV